MHSVLLKNEIFFICGKHSILGESIDLNFKMHFVFLFQDIYQLIILTSKQLEFAHRQSKNVSIYLKNITDLM
jgi:hypothetical protein